MQALWIVSIICMAYGQRRYVIDNIFHFAIEDYIAVAIDVCMTISVNTSIKYTCSDDNSSVTRTAYTGSTPQNCSKINFLSQEIFTMNNKSPCGGDKFSCDGNDEYVMIQYSQSSCTNKSASLGLIPMVLGCYCNGPTKSYNSDCIDGWTGTRTGYSGTTDCTGSNTTVNLSNCTQLSSTDRFVQMTECRLFNTSLPTSSPSNNPSNDPTTLPSKNPTKLPSDDGTPSPSRELIESTSNPTEFQSQHPTESPTIDPFTAKVMQHQEDLDNLEALYQTTLIVFLSTFVLIAMGGFIDAKCIRTNDYFKITQISGVVLPALDMFSDCFFALNISIQNKMNSDYLIPLILCVIFIVIPATTTIIQLFFHSKKHWMYSSDQVRGWLQKRSKALYLVSVLTGNSFAAVSLFNSYIFQLNIFDMGLTEKELTGYSYKRVYSVVLLENVPQLCLQCWYLASIAEFNDPITISSIIFSLISIIVSVLSMLMQKNLSQSQGYVVIKMKITGNTVTTNAKHCKTMKSKLKKKLALLVGTHRSVVEVIKPTPINQGFELKVNFYFGDFEKNRSFMKIDYEKILRDALKNDELKTIFENGWNLADPVIDIISCNEVQSKTERKRSEKIKNDLPKSLEIQQDDNGMLQYDTKPKIYKVEMTETNDNNN